MAITAYTLTRLGEVTTVTVTSDLAGTIYYHWYTDGCYVGGGQSASRSFYLGLSDQTRVEVVDTNDADFDPVAGAPAGWPARRTLWWVRSIEADVASYRVEQKLGAGDWSTLAIVHDRPEAWDYAVMTDRLDDLSDYTWRVVPVDAAGNDGTPFTIGPEQIVRTPDAPNFTITFDAGTTKVTFAE